MDVGQRSTQRSAIWPDEHKSTCTNSYNNEYGSEYGSYAYSTALKGLKTNPP